MLRLPQRLKKGGEKERNWPGATKRVSNKNKERGKTKLLPRHQGKMERQTTHSSKNEKEERKIRGNLSGWVAKNACCSRRIIETGRSKQRKRGKPYQVI